MNNEKDNNRYILDNEGNILICIDPNQKLDFIINFDDFKDIDCVINGKTITLDKEKVEKFLLQFIKESEE